MTRPDTPQSLTSTSPADPLSNLISTRTMRLLDAATGIERGEARELTFIERTFCQLALPYRNPGPGVPVWERRNGHTTLTIQAPYVNGTHRWAYGVTPRLLLMWLTEQVVRDTGAVDGRKVYLGSARSFFRELGFTAGGRDWPRLRQQVENLAYSVVRVTVEVETDVARGHLGLNTVVGTGLELWWSKRDQDDTDPLFGQSYIELSEQMYASMKAHPVPLDRGAVQALRVQGGGALNLDVYTWIKYRTHRAIERGERFPIRVAWSQLAAQFGNTYRRLRAFREYFEKALRTVTPLLPSIDVATDESVLTLRPARQSLLRVHAPTRRSEVGA